MKLPKELYCFGPRKPIATCDSELLLNLQRSLFVMNFDYRKLDRLIKAYNKAYKSNRQSFMFDGEEIVTSYAKYLIEYLSKQLPKVS